MTDTETPDAAPAITERVHDLALKIAAELEAHDRTHHLAAIVPNEDSTPLRIALVGPYNAGKTLLIGALLKLPTDELDQLVAAAPKTSAVTNYAWRQIALLDLPGTLSGNDEHEAQARAGMRRADAVIIVTTVELSGPEETAHIHRLLGPEGFANRAIIVINKMNAENSDPQIVRAEIERRLGDYALAVPIVLTDVRDYVDANNEPDLTDDERVLLRSDSGVVQLIQAIDDLASRGLDALRSEAQAHELARVLDDARDAWTLDEIEEEATALANRLAQAIEAAKMLLHDGIAKETAALEADIRSAGELLSRAVSEEDGSIPRSKTAEADAVQAKANERFDRRMNQLAADAEQILEAELEQVVLAAARFESARETTAAQARQFKKDRSDKVFDRLLSEGSNKLGDWMRKLASGGTAKGGDAHNAAKLINNLLRRDPKPYIHKNLAGKLTRAAKGAGWAANALGPALDIKSIAEAQVRRMKIDNYRKDIRQRFNREATERAADSRRDAEAWAESWLREVTAPVLDDIRAGQELDRDRDQALARIGDLRSQADSLLAGRS